MATTTTMGPGGDGMATRRCGGQLVVHEPGNSPTLWYTKTYVTGLDTDISLIMTGQLTG
jgi:hypothetical protein